MSRKMLKVLILGAMVVSALASASSASAWTTNGPGSFTATTGATRLTASPGPILSCTSPNSATGSLVARSGGVGTGLASVTPIFGASPSTCTVSGLSFTVTCSAASLNGTSYAAPVTTGTISGLSCTLNIPNCTVVVTGTVPATYSNTTFQLTVVSAGQALTYVATGSSCTALGFASSGTRTASYTNSTGGNAVYTVTSAFKPNVVNP